MQNNSNTYFDITIRNKYDSVTTRRKEMKQVIVSLCAAIILCSSLMIFSFDVSSTSETQNSEDIKGKSETYFPTPTREEVKSSNTTTTPTVGKTTEAVTTEEVIRTINVRRSHYNSTKVITTSTQIVSETINNSSENQNNTVVSGQAASVLSAPAIMVAPTIQPVVATSPVETFKSVAGLSGVLLTPSPMPYVTATPDTTINIGVYEADSSVINSASDFSSYQEEKERKEEKRKEELKKKKEREKKLLAKMNWKNGGNAGKSGLFKDTSTRYKRAKAIWKYLKSAGYSDGAAAGVLGNVEQESSINPTSSTGRYKGLYQLDIGDRFGNCIRWCNKNGYDPYSSEGQTRFALEEMVDDGSRKEQFEHFTGYSKDDYPNISNPETAASVWTRGYEGCISSWSSWSDGQSADFQQESLRRSYARKWYNKFKGTA